MAIHQVAWNRLDSCLVLGETKCIYFNADGCAAITDLPPYSSNHVTGRLFPSFSFEEDEEFRLREIRLNAFLKSKKKEGYLFGDLRKGGRPASQEELKRLSGKLPEGVPKGLTRCGECGGWSGEGLDPNPIFANWVMKVWCRCQNDNFCARCHQPLSEYKLNANYYEPKDGQIWHVPGFSGLSHLCPDLQRSQGSGMQ